MPPHPQWLFWALVSALSAFAAADHPDLAILLRTVVTLVV